MAASAARARTNSSEGGEGESGAAGPAGNHERVDAVDISAAALEAELTRRRPIMSRLRQHLKNLNGNVPSSLRLQLWRNLLGLQRSQLIGSNVEIASLERASKQELENQRVIHADVLRTRAHDPLFRTPETQKMLEKLLSYWCQKKGCKYKQGLNEVLAPFIFVAEDASTKSEISNYTGTVFELFYAFVDKMLPSMFIEEDFASLQVCHSTFRILLHFHDAELASHFEDAGLTPELYSTPWFLTAFSHNTKRKDDILSLWDHCLVRSLLRRDTALSPAVFLQFIGLALLQQKTNRASMLQAETYDLPAVVVKLTFRPSENDKSFLSEILSRAEALLSATPSTFLEISMEAMEASSASGTDTTAASTLIQDALERRAMPIHGREVAHWLLREQISSPESSEKVRFFFLDVRSADDFHFQGHFPLSFHVDPVLLLQQHQDTLRNSISGFKEMSQDSFCLCILGRMDDSVTMEHSSKLAKLLCDWEYNRIGFSCFEQITAELEEKAKAVSIVLKSSAEEAECARAAMAELLQGVEESSNDEIKEAEDAIEGDSSSPPGAPSLQSSSRPLIMAKSLAEKGASALVGGISGLFNRVAPRPVLLSPASWKVDMMLNPQEIHQDGFVPFPVEWVGPSKEILPQVQVMIITPNYLVFVEAARGSIDRTDEDHETRDSCRVLNKYSLATLRKISSRKKEPRMLIITFSRKEAGGDFKIGFLTRNQEQNKFAIGLIKTHFIRITQVEK
eukprot:g396.t1